MDAREQRGLQIAALCTLTQKGDVWTVPSQSGAGKYKVLWHEGKPFCTCPDHEVHGGKCKHVYAVEFVIQRQLFSDGTEVETRSVTMTETVTRQTYRQNWNAYNQAQTNEKAMFQSLLANLCDGIVEPDMPPRRGKPRMPMGAAIFGAAFKVYSTVSGRRFMTDMREACEAGYTARAPHYNSIFKILESEEATPILLRLIAESAKPLKAVESTFACDSSGFSTSRFERWFDQKYGGYKSKREWVKCHLMVGVKTNVVTAVEISDSHDSQLLPALLSTTSKAFTVKEICADLAYPSEVNFQAIAASGASPLIPFKINATGGKGGLYAKAFHYFSANRDEFLARYHQRSNVESTFSMIKRKFGDAIRSKTPVAMRNEVLCKCLCHNICCLISAFYELGIEASFGQAV